MASKDDYSSPDRKGKKPTRKGPHDIIKKTAVVLREGVVCKNKETNEVFVPATIKPDQGLRQEISFTKSMTPEEIEKVLKNAFPFLANTKRFFCAKRVQKKKLDFCGERRIWSGEVLNREIRGKSLLYIYCEEENSDQDPSLTAQMEKMQISRNESSSEDCSDSSFETCDNPEVLPELNTNMTLEPFTKERVNYFKFANIVVNEFPKALRQSFEHLWNTTYGQKPGYRIWDDSEEVRKMFLHEEGGTTDVPTDLSYTEWDCSNLFRATIFSQSFSEEDSTGWKTSLSEKYIKSRPHRLAEDELLTSGKSGTSVTKPFSIAINQLRTLRNTLLHLPKTEIDTKEFETYIQLSEEAFGILNVATASIRDISSYSEDDFPTERADKIKEDIMNDMRAELKFLAEEELGRSGKLMKMWNLQLGRMERAEGLLKRMLATLKERKEGLYQLLELIESGERLLSDYAVQPSFRYQVKQLRDDVNAKLEDVRPSPVSVASVLEDKKKLDQQLIEGGTKLPEDASIESLETSLFRLRIGEVKDSTSLEKVTSVLKDKQQTEKQSEDESESFEETLSGNQATSPSMIDKGKDSTSLEEVISVPMDKQQTEKQSGEDESESFEETLSVGLATSPSTIDKGKDSTLHEEVISVPMDKKQTEKQSGEDESESFEETLSVGPGAQDHDIKGKTTTFEAEHKECIRVLPYTNASGQVYVQLYVFCDKNGIPKELKADAQELFGETGVELRWTNLHNYASNIPNIVSVDFKQLEVSQVNDVSKIINKNLPVFSKHRNITAIQPSLKVTNSKQTNDPCIRVYVLGKGDIPFGESEIPNSVEDCPVDIVDGFWCETLGTLKPLTAHGQEEYLRLGASIGVTNNTGTLGAILEDNDGGLYLLSCEHVITQEEGGKVTHPAWPHYFTSIDYHMSEYQNWVVRIRDVHPPPENDFLELVRWICKAVRILLHPKISECENKLKKLFSEKPRTVAKYVCGIREDVEFLGKPFYLDVAIAKLTEKEEEALKKNGYVEIIDTTNYPDGNVTMGGLDVTIANLTEEEKEVLKKIGRIEIIDNHPDGNVAMGESQNKRREWCKSGSTTGYTSLKSSFFYGKAFLRNSEHERLSFLTRSLAVPAEDAGDDMWRRDCILFEHKENLFSYFGDSGAVIFEESEQHPQAMPGFGIVIGGLFSKDRCVSTIAVPLCVALEKLSERLGSRLTLVSKLKTPSDDDGFS